ncbi:MAG: acylphosphatase [Elusimicrobia bacterium]|nr:acylphosphatase [Elusimicrobiota bacterium]
MTRLYLRLSGRVQGVGYRWFARDMASKLGLTGWVRNRRDGSVELEAQGKGEALERFQAILRKDHPYARVDELESRPLAAREGEESFNILAEEAE